MKKIFTQNVVLTAAFFLAFAGMMNAQLVNTLTVTSPSSIAGDYQIAITTAFGDQETNTITGEGTFVDDGMGTVTDACDGTISNVIGKFAFIDRGDCNFDFKALEAQNAGAIAVIICNNDPSEGIPGIGDAGLGMNVSVAVAGMSYQDCQTIRVEAEGACIEMGLAYQCVPPNYGDNVVWGRNTGEGDFNGGIGNWTINNSENACDSTWWYDINGIASGSFTNFTIGSPTACNGAMVFCSDYLDNGGMGAAFIGSGAGGCVAPTGFGYLESPLIDLTQFTIPADNALFLEFSHAYRHFFSEYLVEFSSNGVTWTGGCNPAPLATTNGPNVNETVRIPVPSSLSTANNLAFRFGMNGNYYYWIVDDVRLAYYPSGSDVSMNAAFYATPPQWRTPVNQGIEMPFTIDLVNTGDQTATDISLGVEIFDPAGSEVFNNSFSEDTLDLMNCDTDTGQNNLFPFGYNDTNLSEGRYTGNYIIGVPNDVNLDNNTVPFYFEVSENTFQSTPSQADVDAANGDADPANDLFNMEAMTDGSIFGPDGNSFAPYYAAGNAFKVFNAVDADGDDLTVENVTFGVFEADASGFVDIQLLKLGNGDSNLNGTLEPDEREIVGATTIVLDTIADKSIITVPLWKADGNGTFVGEYIDLEANTDYLLAFITRPLVATSQINLLSYNASLPVNNLRNFDVSSTQFAHWGIYGSTTAAGTYFEPLIDGTLGDFASTGLDGYGINQLWSETKLIKRRLLNSNELDQTLNVSVYPNPSVSDVFVEFNLDNTSNVKVEMFDIQGKLVLSQTLENAQSGIMKIVTTDIPSGAYTLKIITDEGFIAKSLILEK